MNILHKIINKMSRADHLLNFSENKYKYLILLVLLFLVFIDLSNMDSVFYKYACRLLGIVFRMTCPDFYDLPFWEVTVSVGTLATAYFAFAAIKQAVRQSNRQLEIEQTPYVVLEDRISTLSDGNVHIMSLINIGRGMAANITAFTDPAEKISIIEGSNPHSIDLASGKGRNNWALDNGQFAKGLIIQGKKVKSNILRDIPDENSLSGDDKYQADFFVYLRYQDQIGHNYRTKTKIRNSGGFLKVMENKVEKL